MAHDLRRRLDRLTRATPNPDAQTITIWTQANDGSDAFTCTARPGEVLTRAELDALPLAGPDVSQIVVVVTRTDPEA